MTSPALVEGAPLPGGWTVARSTPGGLVRLERATALERADAWRRLGLAVVPLVLALALVSATMTADVGVKWMAWPVALLLGAVTALGLLSAVRGLRRAREGVFLEVDPAARRVRGLVEGRSAVDDYAARRLDLPFDEVGPVSLVAHRGRKPTEPALVRLSIRLPAGHLLGPEAAVADADVGQAEAVLRPAALALAEALGRPALHTLPD